jgi:hypothetical protein
LARSIVAEVMESQYVSWEAMASLNQPRCVGRNSCNSHRNNCPNAVLAMIKYFASGEISKQFEMG